MLWKKTWNLEGISKVYWIHILGLREKDWSSKRWSLTEFQITTCMIESDRNSQDCRSSWSGLNIMVHYNIILKIIVACSLANCRHSHCQCPLLLSNSYIEFNHKLPNSMRWSTKTQVQSSNIKTSHAYHYAYL
jgi:hypothetical protein